MTRNTAIALLTIVSTLASTGCGPEAETSAGSGSAATAVADEAQTPPPGSRDNSAEPDEEQAMYARSLRKKLAPRARKMLLTDKDSPAPILLRVMYRSERERETLEKTLVQKGAVIRSVQKDTRQMSVMAQVQQLEEIAGLHGVVYIDTQSRLRN